MLLPARSCERAAELVLGVMGLGAGDSLGLRREVSTESAKLTVPCTVLNTPIDHSFCLDQFAGVCCRSAAFGKGGRGRGGGSEARTRLRRGCSNFPRPTLCSPDGLRASQPFFRRQLEFQPCALAQGVFSRQEGGKSNPKPLLPPVQQPSCQSLLRCPSWVSI